MADKRKALQGDEETGAREAVECVFDQRGPHLSPSNLGSFASVCVCVCVCQSTALDNNTKVSYAE